MGFAGGAHIFDAVMKVIDEELELSYGQEFELIYALMNALEDADWDTHSDSAYIDRTVVKRVMTALGHQVYDEDEDE